MTLLSCHRFRSNEVRLWLSVSRLQPGESLATFGTAEEDSEVVVDELATALGEDRRAAGETCMVLFGCSWRRVI